MPRKAKDKEELVEKKDVKKENHRGRKAKNSITDKKSVSAKTEKKKTSSKKAKVITSKLNGSPKDATPTSKEKKSKIRATTKKINEFLSEYYDLPLNYNKIFLSIQYFYIKFT